MSILKDLEVQSGYEPRRRNRENGETARRRMEPGESTDVCLSTSSMLFLCAFTSERTCGVSGGAVPSISFSSSPSCRSNCGKQSKRSSSSHSRSGTSSSNLSRTGSPYSSSKTSIQRCSVTTYKKKKKTDYSTTTTIPGVPRPLTFSSDLRRDSVCDIIKRLDPLLNGVYIPEVFCV